ncbi:hypothetical protein EDC04DRAFT_2735254 [Pisolithus marmoratus]|nr:hypothetical protein EDC04DRAFT_2735254 [Pisolithus marmoratus]
MRVFPQSLVLLTLHTSLRHSPAFCSMVLSRWLSTPCPPLPPPASVRVRRISYPIPSRISRFLERCLYSMLSTR